MDKKQEEAFNARFNKLERMIDDNRGETQGSYPQSAIPKQTARQLQNRCGKLDERV